MRLVQGGWYRELRAVRPSKSSLLLGGFFMSSPFRAIGAQIDLPAMEHSILKFWRDNEIFEKSTESREGQAPWTFL